MNKLRKSGLLILLILFLLSSCQAPLPSPPSSDDAGTLPQESLPLATKPSAPKEISRLWSTFSYQDYKKKIANEYAYVFSSAENFYAFDDYLRKLGEFHEFHAVVTETLNTPAPTTSPQTEYSCSWGIAYLQDTPRSGAQYELRSYSYRLIAGNLYWTLCFDHDPDVWETAPILEEEQWGEDFFSCNSPEKTSVRAVDQLRYCYEDNRLKEIQFDAKGWTVRLTDLPGDYYAWYHDLGQNAFFTKLFDPQRAMEAVREFQNQVPAPSESSLTLSSLEEYQDFVKTAPLPKYFVSYEAIRDLGSFQWMQVENTTSSEPFGAYSYMLEKDGIEILCTFLQQRGSPSENTSLFNRIFKFGLVATYPLSSPRGYQAGEDDPLLDEEYLCRYFNGKHLALYHSRYPVDESSGTKKEPMEMNLVCLAFFPLNFFDNGDYTTELFCTISSSQLFRYQDTSNPQNFLMQLLEGEDLNSHQIKEYFGLS